MLELQTINYNNMIIHLRNALYLCYYTYFYVCLLFIFVRSLLVLAFFVVFVWGVERADRYR